MTTIQTSQALFAIKKFYNDLDWPNVAGGSLHITLDDGNVTDDHIQLCKERAIKKGDAAGVVLADMLRKMPEIHRYVIYCLFQKYCNYCDLCNRHSGEWKESEKCPIEL